MIASMSIPPQSVTISSSIGASLTTHKELIPLYINYLCWLIQIGTIHEMFLVENGKLGKKGRAMNDKTFKLSMAEAVIGAIVFSFLLINTACTQSQTANSEQLVKAMEIHQPTYNVIGADRSGSYEDLTKVALSICSRILNQGEPGDKFLFRYISEKSYAHDEVFGRVDLPLLPDASGNPFDTQAKRKQQIAKNRLARVKAKWIAHFEQLRPESAPRTDIVGFICAAADIFEQVPNNYQKRLFLATDLQDNVGYRVKPNLTDVSVLVFALKPGHNPTQVLRQKDRWTKFFQSCGATSVQFQSAEVMQ